MKLLAQIAVVAFMAAAVRSQDSPVRLGAVVINGTTPGVCPPMSDLNAAVMASTAQVEQLFDDAPCGGLGWTQVASIDMGDPAQQCPSPYVESAMPMRSCTPMGGGQNCPSLTFPGPGAPYSRVCGQIYGYSVGTPDAFFGFGTPTIDLPYLDGFSLTTVTPREHIWSFAVGHGAQFGAQNNRCPCANTNAVTAPLPPAFVGDNYYCDNLDNAGELWDAMGCTNACCTFNGPPEFNTTLTTPTSANLELRACHNQNTNDETVHFRLIQLYVQ
jgi:hypothetical protein